MPLNKRQKGRSNSPDLRKRREIPLERQAEQRQWRINCLTERAEQGRLSTKNVAEAARLNVQLVN